MAIAGGVAGTGLGMLLFGPAGAYILGGVSTVLGATQGNIITNRLDRFLDPDRENTLKSLANGLLEKCNHELASKIALLDEKISALSNSGISSYVKYRLGWERIYLQIAIKRHNDLMQNKSITGTKKIFKALRLASESTVHPYFLQSSYKQITQVLHRKVDRKEKFFSLIKKYHPTYKYRRK